MRYDGGGAAMVVDRTTPARWVLDLRVHAEFELNAALSAADGVARAPLFFTPAQFDGRAVLHMDPTTTPPTLLSVESFVLQVPTSLRFNVDLEWFVPPPASPAPVHDPAPCTGEASWECEMRVDIAAVGALRVGTPDPAAATADAAPQTLDPPPTAAAAAALEQALYPFLKAVEYVSPLTEALERARTEHKLLHVLLMWGCLADQSC